MKSSNLRIAVCPLCRNHMNNLEAEKGLYVDFCKPCGVTWLDQGELGQIIGRNADLPSIAKPHSSRFTRAVCSACNQQSLEPWMVETIGFYKCNLCQGILIALKDARKFRQFFQHHSQNKFLEGKKDRNAYEDLGSFQTPHFDLVAIPCVLFIGYWMEYFRLTRYLAWYFSMIFHELGHGVAAWLGGYFAIPTPFAVTFHSGSRSSFVIVAVLAVCCRGFIFAFNARSLASGFFLRLCFQRRYI